MLLGEAITKESWVKILNSTQPGGENWNQFKKKNGDCLKSCPGYRDCKRGGPDSLVCTDKWKSAEMSLENIGILFHIYNEFDHYNQQDLPQLNNESATIRKLREYFFQAEPQLEEDEINLGTEDLRRLRTHKRFERNRKLAEEAKKLHGHKCQACGFDFEKKYGKIGKGFIEAHHLTPLSGQKGKVVSLDPKKDFAVLCSNCHRMIHRTEFISSVVAFRVNCVMEKS